jgi:RTX calcium-binding nonapeptide repeat (4 copies)
VNRYYKVLFLSALFGLLCGSPASAQVPRSVNLPHAGFALIGIVYDGLFPSVVIITQNGSTCTRTDLEWRTDKLRQNTIVHGSSSADWMGFIPGPAGVSYLFCGYPMYHLSNFNGHSLDLWGEGGNDLIHGGDYSTWVVGNNGDDTMTASLQTYMRAVGGAGHDRILGRNRPVELLGGDGDDFLCADRLGLGLVQWFDGGNGTDFTCGSASTIWTDTEFVDCSVCQSTFSP